METDLCLYYNHCSLLEVIVYVIVLYYTVREFSKSFVYFVKIYSLLCIAIC